MMKLSDFKKRTPYWMVGALAFTATAVYAEENVSDNTADTQIEAADEEMEQITVLGSRLRGLDAASQVITMDREFIESGGFSTIEDLFQRLPQGISSRNVATTALGQNEALESLTAKPLTTLGTSGVNLRGMGGQSTLILVNGRRTATSSNSMGGYTDISSIPVSMIERIEILTDGASAIYGADAVAGVVNVILRKDYVGGTLNVRAEDSATGGDSTRVNGGYTFSWDTGSLTASFDASKRDPVDTNELIRSGPMGTGDFTALGGANTRKVGVGGTVYTNPGSWWLPKTFLGLIPEGNDGSNVQPGDLVAGDPNTRSIYERRSVGPEVESNTFRLNGEQQITEEHRFSFDVAVTNQEDTANWQARLQDFGGNITRGLTGVSVDNPNNFMGEPVAVGYTYENEFKSLSLGSESEQDNIAAYISFDGALGFIDDWEYMVDYSYSQEESKGSAIRQRTDFSPESIARNQAFAQNINPFGDGSNADIVASNVVELEKLLSSHSFESESESNAFEISANGPVFDLPGGEAMLAIGVAQRTEDLSRKYPDDELVAPIKYDRDTTSYFAELGMPITEDLTLTVALRREEIEQSGTSTFRDSGYLFDFVTFTSVQIPLTGIDHEQLTGFPRSDEPYALSDPKDLDSEFSQNSPSVKIGWNVTDSFRLRATWGESFLAPRAAQMYGESAAGDNAFLWQMTGHAIPDGSDFNGSPIAYTLGGTNPNLDAQTADTTTVGFDWIPGSDSPFSLSVTYSLIEYDNYIGMAPDPFDGEPFTQLHENLDKAGDVIMYDDTGILIYDQRERNFAQRTSETLDFFASYQFETDNAGVWSFDLNAVNTLELSSTFIPGLEAVNIEGTDVGPSEWVSNFSTNWVMGDFSTTAVLHYQSAFDTLSPLTEWTDSQNGVHPINNPDDDTDAMVTVDANIVWNVPNTGLKVQLGASNLLDEKPDFTNNRSGFAANRYNTRGRVIFLDMSYTFGN